MNTFLEEKAHNGFHPCLSLMRADLARMKGCAFQDQDLWSTTSTDEFERHLRSVLKYAKELDGVNRHYATCEVHLDNAEYTAQEMFRSGQLRVIATHSSPTVKDIRLFFRQRIIMQNLGIYVSRKLDGATEYFKDFDQPPLSLILNTWARQLVKEFSKHENFQGPPLAHEQQDCCQVIQSLLEHKEDINERVTDDHGDIITTPWQEFIGCVLIHRSMSFHYPNEAVFIFALRSGVFNLLIAHGADLNACGEQGSHDDVVHHTTPFWIKWLFQSFYSANLWKYRDQYLQVLGTIFELGVDLKLVDPSKGKLSSHGSGLSFWRCICEKVKELSYEHRRYSIEEPRLKFLAQVFVAFAKATKKELFDWNEMLPSLRRLFSQAQLREILQAMGRDADQETPRLRMRYRVPG